MLRRRLLVLTLAQGLGTLGAAAQPTIFWLNDPVGPDQTIVVMGADLGAVTGATIVRAPDPGSNDPPPSRDVAVAQANPESLKLVVPGDLAPGIYRVTLADPSGTATAAVNIPTVYWVQGDGGDAAAPGGWLRVFGRNIVRRAASARLALTPEDGGSPVAATLAGGDLWQATFRLPAGLAPGRYRLRLSNGDGGDSEAVDAGRIDVRVPPAPTRATFDVRSFGAVGDGRTDDTRAIAAALAEAGRVEGIVRLPRGRYLVSTPLEIPPGVALRGERTDLVNLVWPDLADPPDVLLRGSTRFSIEDLTLYASNHGHVVSGGFSGNTPIAEASDILVRRVRLRASAFRGHMGPEDTYARMSALQRRFPASPASLRLSGRRITVADCDIVGSGQSLLLVGAHDATVSGNVLSNGRYGWYSITGSSRVVFENNLVAAADLQGSGGGINTLYTVAPEVAASENIYIGGNTFKALYGWDREAMTTDGPGGYYYGAVEAAGPDTMRLVGPLADPIVSATWTGAAFMVVAGRGAGQFARVVRAETAGTPPHTTVVMDQGLAVPLDATSVVSIVQMQRNYLIVGNRFEDTGVAAQTYGTAIDHVIADNVSTRTGGFFARSGIYFHFQPNWRIQLLGNRIVEGNVYQSGPDRQIASGEALVAVQAVRPGPKLDWPPQARAIVVRGNRLDDDAHVEVTGGPPGFPGARDVVIEQNTIAASRVGLVIDQGVQWWVERNNTVGLIGGAAQGGRGALRPARASQPPK